MVFLILHDVDFWTSMTGIIVAVSTIALVVVIACTLARYYSLSKHVDVLAEGVLCFDGKNYSGQGVFLRPGYYASNLQQSALEDSGSQMRTMPVRLVRSLVLPRGYVVTLYANETLQGEHVVLRSSVPDLDLVAGSTTRVKTERGTWYNKAHGLIVATTIPETQCAKSS